MIFVRETAGKGRGVFTRNRIRAGEVIEEGPVIVMPPSEVGVLEKTALQDYYFDWGENQEAAAVMLGLCSLCNHSYQPNAKFTLKPETLTIEFVALRDIEPGEEITINYNGDPADQKPIWFPVL